MPGPSQTRAYVALLLMAMLWGSYPVTAKLALRDMPPITVAAIRCALAATFLVVLLLRAGADTVRGLTPVMLRDFLMLGALGIWGSTQVSYLAIYYTTASNVVILQAATPVIVGLGSWLYLGERLGPRQWAGVALSAVGVLFVITDGRLAALKPEELRAGDFITLRVQVTRASHDGEAPVPRARVVLKTLGTSFKPASTFSITDNHGVALIFAALPAFDTGRAAILLRAEADGQTAELRRVVLPA